MLRSPPARCAGWGSCALAQLQLDQCIGQCTSACSAQRGPESGGVVQHKGGGGEVNCPWPTRHTPARRELQRGGARALELLQLLLYPSASRARNPGLQQGGVRTAMQHTHPLLAHGSLHNTQNISLLPSPHADRLLPSVRVDPDRLRLLPLPQPPAKVRRRRPATSMAIAAAQTTHSLTHHQTH